MSKIELPEEIFRYKSGIADVENEVHTRQKVNVIENITFDKGVFMHYKGGAHPMKVCPTSDILYAFNLAKRHLIEPLKFLNKWYFYPGLLMAMRKPEAFIESFNMMTWRFIKPYLLKEEFMTSQSKELEWMIYMFLKNVGVTDENAEQFAATAAHCIEYDTAYRFIVVDLLAIANKEYFIQNSRKEILRIMSYFIDRSTEKNMSSKFKAVLQVLSLILLIPKYRKALATTIKTIDFSKLQVDEIDTYWMCLRTDGYNYMGLSDRERNIYRRSLKKRRPLTITR